MGRVKQYTRRHQHGKKKQRAAKDEPTVEETKASGQAAALTVGKKRQIFKREKAKHIKAKIQELKQRSLKLKKKNLEQKAEKKKIAKEIHRLKASIKACEEVPEVAPEIMELD